MTSNTGIGDDSPDFVAAADEARARVTCEAEVIWAVRYEMARTVEDVLARRVRALFLDAAAARDMTAEVAAMIAEELGRDEAWKLNQIEEFTKLANDYCIENSAVTA